MQEEKIRRIISENTFFKHFNQDEIDLLFNHSSFVEFDEGQSLTITNHEANNFYLIISGTVSIQTFSPEYGTIEIETVQNKEFLDWSWLISPYTYYFDAIAFEKTSVISFDVNAIKRQIKNNHEFGYKLFSVFMPLIVKRLKSSQMNLIALYENSF